MVFFLLVPFWHKFSEQKKKTKKQAINQNHFRDITY